MSEWERGEQEEPVPPGVASREETEAQAPREPPPPLDSLDALREAIRDVVEYLWDEHEDYAEMYAELAGRHIFVTVASLLNWLDGPGAVDLANYHPEVEEEP